jgi:hypothetical protein
MNQKKNNKKEVFSPLRDYIYLDNTYKYVNEVKISSFDDSFLIDQIKTLKVIELDDLKSFVFYLNYDSFLIFKFQDSYYFCDTELSPIFGLNCMIKLIDFSIYLRKDKLKNINLKNK